MFVSRSSLFVTVALLALSAIAEAGQVCKTYQIGTVDSPAFPVPLGDIPLVPNQKDYGYNIQSGGCPPSTGHVGTELTACDEGIAPVVKFIDLSNALITRPNPVATGVVHGKIYCQSGAASNAAAPLASLSAGNVPLLQASVQQ